MRKKHKHGGTPKKMTPGKLKGPSHDDGGILLEAEGGEYIIKKSSVNKIGKPKLDKINKTGELPVKKYDEGGEIDVKGNEGRKHKKWRKKLERLDTKEKRLETKYNKKSQKYVNKQTDKELKEHIEKRGDVGSSNDPTGAREIDKSVEGIQIISAKNKDRHKENYKTTKKGKKKRDKIQKVRDKFDKHVEKKPDYHAKKGGSVGSSIKTYSSGGYVEGK